MTAKCHVRCRRVCQTAPTEAGDRGERRGQHRPLLADLRVALRKRRPAESVAPRHRRVPGLEIGGARGDLAGGRFFFTSYPIEVSRHAHSSSFSNLTLISFIPIFQRSNLVCRKLTRTEGENILYFLIFLVPFFFFFFFFCADALRTS